MNKNKPINIAVVGLGYWGPNLLRNFSQVRNCRVKFGCDLKQGALKKLRPKYPKVRFTRNYKELLEDKDLDAIVIATPVFSHHQLAKLALEYNKHVLLEKPMAASVKECEDLIKTAERNNRFLAVDHTFLFTGAVKKIKELVKNKELGNIYYFDSERINLGLIQSDINVIWDLAPHDLSIMNYILEGAKPISVFATGAKYVNSRVEEMAHITIEFESGQIGHIHVSWLSPVKLRKILIGGSKKMLLWNDIEPHEKIKVHDKGISVDFDEITPFKPAYRSGDVLIPKLDDREALRVEAEHFVNCIRKKEKPLVDGKKGLEVVKILEACDKSLRENRKINLES